MMNLIKDNWCIISAIIGGIIWGVIRGEKVKNLDVRVNLLENEDTINRAACKEIRSTCQRHFNSELSHSASTLSHLSDQFDLAEKRSEERFKLMMAQLIKVSENNRG